MEGDLTRRAPELVLVASPYDGTHRERLSQLFHPAEVIFLRPSDVDGLERHLPRADIAILKYPPDAGILSQERLAWVHCNISGLDACASQEFVQSDLLVTSASGRSAPVLAEHALYFMLALAYNAEVFSRAQRRRVWGARNQNQMRGLHGRKVLIIGMGHTAKALIPRCRALGMDVAVYRRRDIKDDEFGIPVMSGDAGDRLDDLLPEVDIVTLAASLNNTSYEMLGDTQFSLMKQGALLINVARARLVETQAFKRALRTGPLAGAGIDVTDPEPLPPWDELWRRRNVLITPHVTPRVADRAAAEIDIIQDNYARYLSGEPLQNQLRPEDLFSRGSTDPMPALARRICDAWGRIAKPLATKI